MFTRRIPWGAGHFQLFAKAAFALVSLTLAFSITTLAQTGQNHGDTALAAKVRALNNQLLQLHAQFQQGLSGNGAAAARSQAATVIAARAAALQSLIQQDPRAALSFAFSPELLADLATKFARSSSMLESRATVTGQPQRWIADSIDLKTSHSYFILKTASQSLTLHFAGAEPTLKPGESLKAVGILVGSEMAVSSATVLPAGSSELPGSIAIPTAGNGGRQFVWLFLALAILPFVLMRSTWRWRPFRPLGRQCAAFVAILTLVVCSPLSGYAQGACSTTGPQNTLVILTTFPNVVPPSSVTPTSMNALFFGPAPSLTNFWQEASNGQASTSGTVVGWYTLTGSYSCGNVFSSLAPDAIAAAMNAGINVNDYTRVFVLSPDMSCGLAGLSTVGCTTVSTSAGTFNVSLTVLFTNNYFLGNSTAVVDHEAGHQLGLDHSKLRQYTDATGNLIPVGALTDPGSLLEYGDHYSVMGADNWGLYAAGHEAEVLGWLASGTDYQTVTSSGTFLIEPYEATTPGLKALKVQRGTNNPGYYLWIEYRQPLGDYDSTYTTHGPYGPYATQLYSGAYIHYEDSTTGTATHLLDFTAPAAYNDDPALVAGQTWTDPYSNLSLSVSSATSSGLTLTVNYGAIPCTSSAPAVTVSPLNPSIYPGQSASYSVSVTNNDSSGCSASTINLASSQPSGWTTSFSSPSLTLSPGQSASLTMGKGAPSGTPAGTYAVDLTASSSSNSGSGTANATVVTPPTLAVAVSVSGTTFAPPTTVSMSASVTNGGTPASGASVTFTLTGPTGNTTAAQTLTTGTNGIATWNYRLNSKAVAGTYSVTAKAALGSGGGSGGKKGTTTTTASTQTATSNSVTFSVL